MKCTKLKIVCFNLLILIGSSFIRLHAQNNTSEGIYKLTGVYDTLFVDSATFMKISNHKLVFQYFVDKKGRFSLHGWTAEGFSGRRFSPRPSLLLTTGKPGKYTYEENQYLGDLILGHSEIKALKRIIKDSAVKLVLFAPTLDKGIMTYKVFGTRDADWDKKVMTATNTGPAGAPPAPPPPPGTSTTASGLLSTEVIANPSPPRNFKNGKGKE